jgi:hypothetical protein
MKLAILIEQLRKMWKGIQRKTEGTGDWQHMHGFVII